MKREMKTFAVIYNSYLETLHTVKIHFAGIYRKFV